MRFTWDSANIEHLLAHGVTSEEAQEVFLGNPVRLMYQSRKGELRRKIGGYTNTGRYVIVIYVIRNGAVRIVTAYPKRPR